MTLRIVDFAALRAVDAIILSQFGAAALGLYTVASRVYSLLLQLLQATVASVALSVLSRIAHDPGRLRRAFLRSTSLAASLGIVATPSYVIGGATVLGYPGEKTLAALVSSARSCGLISC